MCQARKKGEGYECYVYASPKHTLRLILTARHAISKAPPAITSLMQERMLKSRLNIADRRCYDVVECLLLALMTGWDGRDVGCLGG